MSRTNRELPGLAKEIQAAHEACLEMLNHGLDRAREIGEKLGEAKRLLPHGDFTGWIEHECGFTARTGRNYMRIANHWPEIEAAKSERGSVFGIAEARKLLASPKAASPEVGELADLLESVASYLQETNELLRDLLRRDVALPLAIEGALESESRELKRVLNDFRAVIDNCDSAKELGRLATASGGVQNQMAYRRLLFGRALGKIIEQAAG